MSEGSSHREATTENTYIDLGADTAEGFSISSRSRRLARAAIGSENDEDRIRQRCSIAVGDFEMAKLLRFQGHPIEAGLQALRNKAPILVDIRMVQVGVQKKGHGSEVKCFLDYGQDISKEKGITRTSAGIMALQDQVEGAIIVIGNAPSSLLVLCDMIRQGIRPALVIGAGRGFRQRRRIEGPAPDHAGAIHIGGRYAGRDTRGGGRDQRDHHHPQRGCA